MKKGEWRYFLPPNWEKITDLFLQMAGYLKILGIVFTL